MTIDSAGLKEYSGEKKIRSLIEHMTWKCNQNYAVYENYWFN